MEASSIKSVLKEVFEGIEGGRQKREQAVVSAWEKAVGPKAALHTRILAARNETLIVGVDSSPWLYLLSLYKQRILKKMERGSPEFQEGKIRHIQFKTVGGAERMR